MIEYVHLQITDNLLNIYRMPANLLMAHVIIWSILSLYSSLVPYIGYIVWGMAVKMDMTDSYMAGPYYALLLYVEGVSFGVHLILLIVSLTKGGASKCSFMPKSL